MRNRLAIALSVVGVLAMAGPLRAHHAASSYDNTREIKMEGIVTEFKMINPHPQLLFTVKAKDGSVEEWFGESQSPPYRWFNNGWKANTIKAGDVITIIGRPSREEGRKRVNITKIFGPDGTEYPPKGGRVGPLE